MQTCQNTAIPHLPHMRSCGIRANRASGKTNCFVLARLHRDSRRFRWSTWCPGLGHPSAECAANLQAPCSPALASALAAMSSVWQSTASNSFGFSQKQKPPKPKTAPPRLKPSRACTALRLGLPRHPCSWRRPSRICWPFNGVQAHGTRLAAAATMSVQRPQLPGPENPSRTAQLRQIGSGRISVSFSWRQLQYTDSCAVSASPCEPSYFMSPIHQQTRDDGESTHVNWPAHTSRC